VRFVFGALDKRKSRAIILHTYSGLYKLSFSLPVKCGGQAGAFALVLALLSRAVPEFAIVLPFYQMVMTSHSRMKAEEQ
jgi:hypothetical protein